MKFIRSYLKKDEHQEIKTVINHEDPNCKSHQKIKKILGDNSRGIFQGKIFVNERAQKTNAYQLSNALILNDAAEFNAKPELEIYADDVKCSHGSSSGNLDKDAIYYLMARGIEKGDAIQLLVKGFLSEIIETIKLNYLKEVSKNILKRVHFMKINEIRNNFPIFKTKINGKKLVYLDSANCHKNRKQ